MTRHILVIDDEEEIRALLREALAVAGYRITGVGTGADAMQVVRDDPPQLIITDLQLEHADGFSVVDQVRAVAPAIPIILLTGVIVEPEEIPAVIGEKIAAYIPKTASLEEILREVKRLTK